MIGDWWLVLSFEQLFEKPLPLPRLCEYVIFARHEPKNLNSPVCDWRVQKLLDPVRQSEFIEHLLMKKGARWLIMAYPSYSPSSSSNSPSSSAVASSHEEERHVFCHVWGDRDPTLGCQSLAFAGWLQNLILSYVNACDCTEWSSCIVMWDKVPLFMITLTYIQLVRVHSHLQTTPLMMQDRTNTSPMYIQCIYLGINDYQRLTKSSMETNHTDPSWYCWYSETKSFMLDSASVNSISSIPSPVYQWRKALRRNIAVKYLSLTYGLAGCRNLEAEGLWNFQYVWAGKTSGAVYEHHNNFPTKATPKNKTFDSTKLDGHKKSMDPNKNAAETWMSGSATLLNISWMAVEFPANATAIFKPLGGMSHTEACKTAYAGRNANPSDATLVGSLKYNIAMVNIRFHSKNIFFKNVSTVTTLWHPPIYMNVACKVPFGNFRTSAPGGQTSINKENCVQRSSPQ